MSISLQALQCPSCGGNFSIEEGMSSATCPYCRMQITLTNDNEHIIRTIDEAKVKEVEAEKLLQFKELEIEERENERRRKIKIVKLSAVGVLVAIGLFLTLMDNSIDGLLFIVIGAWIGLFSMIGDDKKKRKRANIVTSDEALITERMMNYRLENFSTVVARFKGAGFVDVEAVPMEDLTLFNIKNNGQVSNVTINGNDEFEEGDVFNKTASVVITYHSKNPNSIL